MKLSPALIGLGAAVVLLGAGSTGRASSGSGGLDPLSGGTGFGGLEDDDPPPSAGQPEYEQGVAAEYDYSGLPDATGENHEFLRYYLEEAGLHPYWVVFFEAMAANESNFKDYVGLGDPALYPDWAQPSENVSMGAQQREHEAAIRAYERNYEYLQDCGFSADRYTFGSGGWFALLPPNGLKAFNGTNLQCMDPYMVFDPAASVVMVIEMVRRLMRWKGWKSDPTFANLRAGLKNPSEMGDPEAIFEIVNKDKGLFDRYVQIGANTDLIDMTPPPLPPKNPVALYAHLNSL